MRFLRFRGEFHVICLVVARCCFSFSILPRFGLLPHTTTTTAIITVAARAIVTNIEFWGVFRNIRNMITRNITRNLEIIIGTLLSNPT